MVLLSNNLHDNRLLLLDAVTIVLYSVTLELSQIENAGAKEVILGAVSFFTVSLGGALLGVLSGFLAAIITRFTAGLRGMWLSLAHNQISVVVEPVVLYATAYLAYILAELFEWSGIVA